MWIIKTIRHQTLNFTMFSNKPAMKVDTASIRWQYNALDTNYWRFDPDTKKRSKFIRSKVRHLELEWPSSQITWVDFSISLSIFCSEWDKWLIDDMLHEIINLTLRLSFPKMVILVSKWIMMMKKMNCVNFSLEKINQ